MLAQIDPACNGVFVNSSTSPQNIATASQKQSEMVWAQNLILSRDDRKREKPHWQWWTTGSDYERWIESINNLPRTSIIRYHTLSDGVGPIFQRQIFPEISMLLFQTRQRQNKMTDYHDKACNWAKNGLTMTVDTGRTSQAIIPPLAISSTPDPMRQDHPSVIVVSDPQEEISTTKVGMSMVHEYPNWQTNFCRDKARGNRSFVTRKADFFCFGMRSRMFAFARTVLNGLPCDWTQIWFVNRLVGEDSIDVSIKEWSWKLIAQLSNGILPQLRRGASIEAHGRIDTRFTKPYCLTCQVLCLLLYAGVDIIPKYPCTRGFMNESMNEGGLF